jgi:hypothetical protein
MVFKTLRKSKYYATSHNLTGGQILFGLYIGGSCPPALQYLEESIDRDIVRVIKVARIRWRMEKNSLCKKIIFSQPEGSRKKGRLKLRWLDSVLKDVKLLKVETRWKKALVWNIWGRIIKEDKVHKGH